MNRIHLFLIILTHIVGGLTVHYLPRFIDIFVKKVKLPPFTKVIAIFSTLLISSLFIWRLAPHVPKASPIFSDFEKGYPINNYGCHWDIFDDGPYNGDSTIKRHVLLRARSEKSFSDNDKYYLVIEYLIGNSPKISLPYCGVASGFSSKALEYRDVSEYSAISFEAWHEGETPPGIRFILEITPAKWFSGTGDENHFKYDFTDDIGRTQGRRINVPFSLLGRKSLMGDVTYFDNIQWQKEVQQIAIIILGEPQSKAQGRLCVDSISFIN